MQRLICAAADLSDGGSGVRFCLDASSGGGSSAFAVRWHGKAFAYRNACPHAGVELDWNPGVLFDVSGEFLVCAMHGALFEPDTGACVAGPCVGLCLEPLSINESEGNIYLEA